MPIWRRNTSNVLTLGINGAVPVPLVSIELVGDGWSSWYYAMADARGTNTWTVLTGPRTGRFQLLVSVMDVNGCESMLAPGTYITVQP